MKKFVLKRLIFYSTLIFIISLTVALTEDISSGITFFTYLWLIIFSVYFIVYGTKWIFGLIFGSHEVDYQKQKIDYDTISESFFEKLSSTDKKDDDGGSDYGD